MTLCLLQWTKVNKTTRDLSSILHQTMKLIRFKFPMNHRLSRICRLQSKSLTLKWLKTGRRDSDAQTTHRSKLESSSLGSKRCGSGSIWKACKTGPTRPTLTVSKSTTEAQRVDSTLWGHRPYSPSTLWTSSSQWWTRRADPNTTSTLTRPPTQSAESQPTPRPSTKSRKRFSLSLQETSCWWATCTA